MFVHEEVTVDVGCRTAQTRFATLLRGSWLAEASEAAYHSGITGLLRVGPSPVAAKLVRVRFLDPVYRGHVMTLGLRWEATGTASGLFPVMDADISISPAEEEATPAGKESSRLALSGSYRPPLGRLGVTLDRVIMNRVARATVHSLLRSVADAVASPATTGHTAPEASPGLRPAPEAGIS